MMRWFRRDPPDRELLVQLRELHSGPRTAKTCRDRKTGELWDKPDGRERVKYTFRVLRSALRRVS